MKIPINDKVIKTLFSTLNMSQLSDKEWITNDATVDAKEAAEAARAKLDYYASSKSGVPEKYWKESLDTYKTLNAEQERAIKFIKKFLSLGGNTTLLLCGPYGVGKTHLGCGIIRERGGLYTTVTRIEEALKEAPRFGAKISEKQIFEDFCTQKMLVIDEVFRNGSKINKDKDDLVQRFITNVLSERYARLKPTVLISNNSMMRLVEYLQGMIASRLNECGMSFEFHDTSDYRSSKKRT